MPHVRDRALRERAIMQSLKVSVGQLPDPLPMEEVKTRCLALGDCQVNHQDSSLTVVFASEAAVLQTLFEQHFQSTLKAPKSAYSFESVLRTEEKPREKSRSRSRSPAGPTNVSVSTEETKPAEELKDTQQIPEAVCSEETKTQPNPQPVADPQAPEDPPKPDASKGTAFVESDGSKWIVIRKKADDDRTQLQCQPCKKLILKRSMASHIETKTHKINTVRAAK